MLDGINERIRAVREHGEGLEPGDGRAESEGPGPRGGGADFHPVTHYCCCHSLFTPCGEKMMPGKVTRADNSEAAR